MQMPSVETIVRVTLGAVAGLLTVIPLFYALAWAWFIVGYVLALLMALGAAYFAGKWVASSGYDKLTDGCASLVNVFRGSKAVA